jgi:hypothetical protein
LLALISVSIAIILIIIRTIVELVFATKYNSSNNDDDQSANIQSYSAWIVVSFLLILMFNSISFRFLYLFYLRLEEFQQLATSNAGNFNPVAVAMANRPIVTEAYVSNSPFAAQQGQIVQGQIVQGQVVQVNPVAVPVQTVHINSFTPHNAV